MRPPSYWSISVNEPTQPTQDQEFRLRKKDREALADMLTGHAILGRPLWTRNFDWLDLTEVSGARLDGGLVAFQLSQVSHLTTHLKTEEDAEKNVHPEDLPAVVHFLNGDFIVMRDSFKTWSGKLEAARYRAYKNLGKPVEE